MSWKHRWLWLGGLLVVVLALAGWFGYQAEQARADLKAAGVQAREVQGAIRAGRTPAAERALTELQRSSRAAASRTDGFLWPVAARLPVVGDDVAAVRTVSSVLDDVSRRALPPLARAASGVDLKTFSPRNGRVDLTPLKQIAPLTGPALKVLTPDTARIDSIDAGRLLPALRTPVTDLQHKLGKAERMLSTADTTLRVLPGMLGDQGPRSYLVVFQNNDEIRATGGLPGAFAILTAKDGKLSLGRQGSLVDFPQYPAPVLPLTHDEKALFTDQLGVYAGDTTLTPDFPRAAQLTREMWRRQSGQDVDGVLSVDPVALSYILKGTGPIPLGQGQTLTADNAVRLLLHDSYAKLSPTMQDRFFAGVAGKVFGAIAAGKGNPEQLVQGVARGVHEHRVMVWSARADEQRVLEPTTVSGALPDRRSPTPHVGVYLNDATGAKMDYYLHHDATVRPVSCSPSGVQTLRTSVTLRSTAPADAATSLPDYVVGGGNGVPRGQLQVKLDVYAPTGGSVGNVRLDGKKAFALNFHHEGRSVADTWILLKPGQTSTVTMDVRSGTRQRGDVHVDVTPGAEPGDLSHTVPTGCR